MQGLAFSLTSRRRQGRQVAGQGGLGGQVLRLSSGVACEGEQGLRPRWTTAGAGLAVLPTLFLTGAGSAGSDLMLAPIASGSAKRLLPAPQMRAQVLWFLAAAPA